RERRREQDEERRKQSPCPADPEGPQVDPPMHTPLVDEQARNEVATAYEEDFDAEESARQPVESRVVQQHGEDGDCAQAIQACETTQTRGGFELGFGRFGAGFGIDAKSALATNRGGRGSRDRDRQPTRAQAQLHSVDRRLVSDQCPQRPTIMPRWDPDSSPIPSTRRGRRRPGAPIREGPGPKGAAKSHGGSSTGAHSVASATSRRRRGWAHPETRIEAFLRERERWLRRHLDRFARERAELTARGRLGNGALVRYRGVLHALRIEPATGGVRRSTVTREGGDRIDELVVRIAVADRRPIQTVLTACLRERARAAIDRSIASHAPALGVTPAAISLRDPRTRWGSASRNGRLSFSWRLVLAPPEALETVVIHELAHLRVFGHGPRFWD